MPAKRSAQEMAEVGDAPEPEILPSTRIAAARLFESTRNFDRAIEQYKKTIARDPKHVEAYHRLGLLQGALGRYREAEEHLRKAVELEPNSASLRNNLAFQLMTQSRWAEAERELRRALTLDPGYVMARTNLGLVLGTQKRFDEALVEFRRVLPEPDAYYNLGIALRSHRRWAEASEAFRRVLAADPNFDAAHKQLKDVARLESEARIRGVVSESATTQDSAVASFSGPEASSPEGAGPAAGSVREQESLPTGADFGAAVVEDGRGIGGPANGEFGGGIGADGEGAPTWYAADLNGDGIVDGLDGSLFAECFAVAGETIREYCRSSDADGDGDVDLADFRILQAEFAK